MKSLKSFSIEVNLLSRYRPQLMGVATLMIIACHAPASGVILPSFLARILQFGNYGVDIFLFLSGLGCYYSLSKNITGIKDFWRKRFIRIMLPYTIMVLPFCIIYQLLGKNSILDSIYCLTTLEYWLYHKGAWFVSLMLPLYMISPAIFKLSNRNYFSWVYAILLIASISFLSSIPSSNSLINNIQFALSRVPNFILGMTIAPHCINNKRIHVLWIIALVIVFVYFSYLHIGLFGWAITPLLIWILLVAIKLSSPICSIAKLTSWLGRISLESYLSNIYLISLFQYLIPLYISSQIFYGRYLEYTIVIIFGLFWAYTNHLFVEFIKRKFNKSLKGNY